MLLLLLLLLLLRRTDAAVVSASDILSCLPLALRALAFESLAEEIKQCSVKTLSTVMSTMKETQTQRPFHLENRKHM